MNTWHELVGRRCRGWSERRRGPAVYKITSYDPTYGFRIVDVDDESDVRGISERAIDRTFFLVTKTYGGSL